MRAYDRNMHTTQTIIAQLRALGLSQSQIAHEAGLTQCTVSRWSTGYGAGSADAGIRLARILDAKVAGIVRKQRVKAAT